ncbi:Eco57I restriction-modification methylase domain-containing protein [Paratractidigestivibacter faecalis]|uniref:Eco57I restriction-modification methylase domain-containing protein n=1 Tax=Paratractidigestivibacter faecalis TaxID=2292441 RepID=UPI00388D8E57
MEDDSTQGPRTEAADATVAPGLVESFVGSYPTHVLETLLADRTTGRNIVWANDEYAHLGEGYGEDDQMTVPLITGKNAGLIRPRVQKRLERQSSRTKSRAEVFTPSWLCNQMNNDLDETWFGCRDVFTSEGPQSWEASGEPVCFPKARGRGWHAYVESPMLEVTCGEAPFVCSRYDTVTGDALPVRDRVGYLDRKLRVVSEQTKTRKTWAKWALAALRATHGFEYQGDNLLIARINVLRTFCEHMGERWGKGPTAEELDEAAWVVSWNFWQMNGLTLAVPSGNKDVEPSSGFGLYSEPAPEPSQGSIFDLLGESADESEESPGPPGTVPLCVIYDWNEHAPFEYACLRNGTEDMAKKKFYAVIGNPPYQESVEGTSDKPIYNYFLDEAYRVADRAELITPGRFLFNAGKTPKEWNRKMLSDPHLMVLHYEQKSASVFPNTDIKGGVAVTYRDAHSDLGPIGVFSAYEELRSIQAKISPALLSDGLLSSVMFLQNRFNLKELYADYPDAESLISSNGRERRIVTSSFDKLPVFTDEQVEQDSVRIVGLLRGNRRKFKWIARKYIEDNGNLSKYKVILPMANGSGALGEVLSTPLIGEPQVGYTQSFMGIGAFEDLQSAEAAMKYIKTKFARTLLGILKITQHNTPEKWAYVPLQDFTSASDIDWSRSISDIDRQLYRKYGLTENETSFIEDNVKEMS